MSATLIGLLVGFSLLTDALLFWYLRQHRQERLADREGVSQSALGPAKEGKVSIEGKPYRAFASTHLEAGHPVKVVGFQGLLNQILLVRPRT